MQTIFSKTFLLFFFFLSFVWCGPKEGCLLAQFNFIHITDMHVSDAASYVNGNDLNGELARCYLEEFSLMNPRPAFIIASGDISNIGENSSGGMYSALTQHLFPAAGPNPGPGAFFIDSALTIPIYFTPGNHEYYSTLTPPVSSSTLSNYTQNLAPDSDYVVSTSTAVVFLMRSGKDAARPIWEDPNVLELEGSGLSGDQISWLRERMAEASGKRKIIAMHHPAVNVAGTNWDGTPHTGTIWDASDGSILNNRGTFMDICDSNQVDIVLGGHVHMNVVASRDGNVVTENWSGGTRYIQTSAALNRSYRIISVDPAFVTVSSPLLSCIPAGISNASGYREWAVFPNPSKGKFFISGFFKEGEPGSVQIFNVLGERIFYSHQPATEDIDISGYSKGIYFVMGFCGTETFTQKIVVH